MDAAGYWYEQETGTSADGSSMSAFIESYPMEISSGGENLYMIDKVIPDATLTSDTSLYIELKARKGPNAKEVTKEPCTIASTTTK